MTTHRQCKACNTVFGSAFQNCPGCNLPARKSPRLPLPLMFCTTCEQTVMVRRKLAGSGWITCILLLAYIVPGLIYMIWRRSAGKNICTTCGSNALVPLDSPRAQRALNG